MFALYFVRVLIAFSQFMVTAAMQLLVGCVFTLRLSWSSAYCSSCRKHFLVYLCMLGAVCCNYTSATSVLSIIMIAVVLDFVIDIFRICAVIVNW